jgi:3-oxoacyl-[acyl-carrier-protein] synthase II
MRPEDHGDLPPPHPEVRQVRYALAAAREAVETAGLAGAYDPARTAVYIGAGKGPTLGALPWIAEIVIAADGAGVPAPAALLAAAARLAPRDLEVEGDLCRAALLVARRWNALGPNHTCQTACAAGAQAIGEAARAIARGEADAAIAGGTHSMVDPLGIISFSLLQALSTRNEEPERASRPFDRGRDGFVLAEGAAVVVLEEAGAARARGAASVAEVAGYGLSCDAYRVTDPPPEGDGPARAMAAAIADAGVRPDAIDYLNAHGTSTRENDRSEAAAIRRVLGAAADRAWVSSTKSVTGHLICAAGALETIVCALAIRDGVVPPNANLDDPDPACPLRIAAEATPADVRHALNNAFGFGGQNVALVLARPA